MVPSPFCMLCIFPTRVTNWFRVILQERWVEWRLSSYTNGWRLLTAAVPQLVFQQWTLNSSCCPVLLVWLFLRPHLQFLAFNSCDFFHFWENCKMKFGSLWPFLTNSILIAVGQIYRWFWWISRHWQISGHCFCTQIDKLMW